MDYRERRKTIPEKYLELEKLRFSNKFDYHIETERETEKLKVPAMLFQPYVENAIRHGIRHLENKKGKVEIRLLQRNGMLECRIDDNGIGREKAQQIQKNTHIEYQSKGMQLSRRRAALYGIDCEILDKKNEEGKPEGTTVILKIPLNEIQF